MTFQIQKDNMKPSDIAPVPVVVAVAALDAHTDDQTRHHLGLQDGARRRGGEFMLVG